jgi:hypothetical protein
MPHTPEEWSPIPDPEERLGRRRRLGLVKRIAPIVPVPIESDSKSSNRDTLEFRSLRRLAEIRRGMGKIAPAEG